MNLIRSISWYGIFITTVIELKEQLTGDDPDFNRMRQIVNNTGCLSYIGPPMR